MLGWVRQNGIVQRSIAVTVIASMLSTSTAALAATVVPQRDVNTGQQAGMEFLGGAQSMPTVSEGTSTLDKTSSNTELFIGDFMPGVTGTVDTSTYEALQDDPDGLVAVGMVQRTVDKEIGCRKTTFSQKANNQTVIRIVPVWRMSNGSETPAAYSGPIRVNFPSLGTASRQEVIAQASKNGTPALVLKYELTPFSAASNQYFIYSPSVVGTVTGSFTSIGNPGNNFTLQGSFTASNSALIEVKASLFKVSRQFEAKPTCDPDPQTACLHQGIDICHPVTSSLKSYFAKKTETGENDVGVVGLDLAIKSSNAKDPDADYLGLIAAPTMDGQSEEIQELFQGCTKTVVEDSTSSEEHIEDIVVCQGKVAPTAACTMERKLTAVKTGKTATVYLDTRIPFFLKWAMLLNPFDGGYWIKTTMPLWPMYGPRTPNDQVTDGVTWNDGSYPSIYRNVGVAYVGNTFNSTVISGGTAGQTFVLPDAVLSGGAEHITWNNYGSAANGWKPTATFYVGKPYTIRFAEWQLVDTVVTSGGPSCDFIVNSVADGRCTASSMGATCLKAQGSNLVNGTIPTTGAYAGIGALLGSNNLLPPNCALAEALPSGCQASGSLTGFLPNIMGPTWLDNCHVTGAGYHRDPISGAVEDPNTGLVGAKNNGICQRVEQYDTCTDQGASGYCYGKDFAFDCGQVEQRKGITATHVQETCSSPIRCLGTECGNTVGEVNPDLTKAMAGGNMVDAMTEDMICEETGEPPTGPYDTCTIRVFNGEPKRCTTPTLTSIGAPDCCKEGASAAASSGIGVMEAVKAWDAMKGVANNPKFTSMLAKMPGSSYVTAIEKAATDASKAVVRVTKQVTNQLVGYARDLGKKILGEATETVAKKSAEATGQAAAGAGGGTTIGAAISGFASNIMLNVHSFLTKIGMEAVADQLIKVTAETVTETVAGQVVEKEVVTAGAGPLLQFLNVAMLIYSLSQIALQMLYACEEEDYELGMERAKKNCSYVGQYCSKEFPSELGGGCEIRSSTYCCYKSPLNRIIGEQLRAQYGGFGSAQNPVCEGITLEQMEAADWGSIDLTEWEQLLHLAGIAPDESEEAEQKWGMESDWAEVKTHGPSFESDGKVTPVAMMEDRFTDAESQFEESREILSDMEACSYNGGVQWYGSPVVAQDEGHVDIYAVTKRFRVTARGSYDGCPGGSDGEFRAKVDPDVTYDIYTDSVKSSKVSRYCDSVLHSVVDSQGVELLDTIMMLNGDVISSLPTDLDKARCEPAPEADVIGSQWYATTHANSNQQLLPNCVSYTSTRFSWVQDKGTASYDRAVDIDIQYQFRVRSTVAVEQPQTPKNCIDPSAQ